MMSSSSTSAVESCAPQGSQLSLVENGNIINSSVIAKNTSELFQGLQTSSAVELVKSSTGDMMTVANLPENFEANMAVLSQILDSGLELFDQSKVFDTFTCFPNLPQEIQIMIWKLAIPRNRKIRIKIRTIPGAWSGRIVYDVLCKSRTRSPAVLCTCFRSRDATLPVYEILIEDRVDPRKRIYWKPEIETVSFQYGTLPHPRRFVATGTFRDKLQKIQLLDLYDFNPDWRQSVFHLGLFYQLPALRRLHLKVCQGNIPIHALHTRSQQDECLGNLAKMRLMRRRLMLADSLDERDEEESEDPCFHPAEITLDILQSALMHPAAMYGHLPPPIPTRLSRLPLCATRIIDRLHRN